MSDSCEVSHDSASDGAKSPSSQAEFSNTSESESNNNESAALDDLLDSALDDFDKTLPDLPEGAKGFNNKSKAYKKAQDDILEKDIKSFQDSLAHGDPQFQSQLEQLTAGAASAANFPESFEDIMKAFQDSGNFPEPTPEELQEVFNKFADMGFGDPAANGGGGGQNFEFMPFMQRIMQNLLSKEMLYPAMKDITGKYVVWLSENKDNLTAMEYANYKKQYEIMTCICKEFEQCNDSSGEGQSFENILALMQQMQECGNPPKEIIGETPMNIPFDEMNLNGEGMPEQCSIM